MANADSRMQGSGMLESVTSLPPSKRYIIAHDAAGKSIVHSSPLQLYFGHPSVGGVARSFSTATSPLSFTSDADIASYLSADGETSFTGRHITPLTTGGSNLNVCELAPGMASQMHRTVSLDYVICTHGHVRLELDSGVVVDLGPGDHVVQRGTLHKWINGSETEPCRFIAVILPAEAGEIPGIGKTLVEEHVSGSEAKDWDVSKLSV